MMPFSSTRRTILPLDKLEPPTTSLVVILVVLVHALG